jgi:hypothetical protein
MDVGRNDPCPCGSGKKYKKCCLNIRGETPPSFHTAETELLPKEISDDEYELVAAGEVGDYGTPVLTQELFDQLSSKVPSSYDFISSLAERPHLLQKANQMVRKILFRGKEEARKIKKAESPEALVEIMLSNPDPLNHHLLLDRVLETPSLSIPLILDELAKPQRNSFAELAVQAIYRSNFYPEDDLLKLVTEPNATAYDLSLICMLLGMLEIEEATKPLWDYYQFFRKKFPHREYWKGPLTGLAEIKYRQDHPIEVTQEQCDLVVQCLQQSGISVSSFTASRIIKLVYARRVLKLLETLFGEVDERRVQGVFAENEHSNQVMLVLEPLLKTIQQFQLASEK